MNGLRLFLGRLGHPFRRTPGRSGERALEPEQAVNSEKRTDQGGFSRAGSARNDQNAATERLEDRLALILAVPNRKLALRPVDQAVDIVRRHVGRRTVERDHPAGDRVLVGAVFPRKDVIGTVDAVIFEPSFPGQGRDGAFDHGGFGPEFLRRRLDKTGKRQADVPVDRRVVAKDIVDPRGKPRGRVGGKTEIAGDGVGAVEPDRVGLFTQNIGVLADHADGAVPPFFVDV